MSKRAARRGCRKLACRRSLRALLCAMTLSGWVGSAGLVTMPTGGAGLALHSVAAAQSPTVEDRCPAAIPASPASVEQQAKRSDRYRQAHTLATGKGIRIAVIDTGINPQHRLPVRILEGPLPGGDCDGHGTVVAGIIAGRDTGDAVVGVAPGAEVLSIKQSSAFAREEQEGSLATLADAIHRALDARASVVNISIAACADPHIGVDLAPLTAALERAERANAVVVAAAGNAGEHCRPGDAVYPAHSPTVLAVGANNVGSQAEAYSLPGNKPPLSAEGHVAAGVNPRAPGLAEAMGTPDQAAPFEGTSFATPVVSGTIALLRERYPRMRPEDLRAHLYASVDPGTGFVDPYSVLITRFHQQDLHLAEVQPQAAASNEAARLSMWMIIGCLGVVLLLAVGAPSLRHQRRSPERRSRGARGKQPPHGRPRQS